MTGGAGPGIPGRILVTGASGMVGRAVVPHLAESNEVVTTSRSGGEVAGSSVHIPWDLGRDDVPGELESLRPSVVFHLAAMTDVDACEGTPDVAHATNVEGTRRVVGFARRHRAALVLLSTDSVFDGARGGYTDRDDPRPLNVYARTKLAAEVEALTWERALVVRCNVIGPGRLTEWVLSHAAAGSPITVFTDVVFNPLEIRDLAALLRRMVEQEIRGLVHAASDEAISKAEFAGRLVRYANLTGVARLNAARLAEAPLRAPRPLDTSLVPSAIVARFGIPSLDGAIRRLAGESRHARPDSALNALSS